MAPLYYTPSVGYLDADSAPTDQDRFRRVLAAFENLAKAEDELAAAIAEAGEAFQRRLSVVPPAQTA